MAPRIDINRGLFTDFPIVQGVRGGRWTPRVVRYLDGYGHVPAAILALHCAELEPEFHMLRKLLAAREPSLLSSLMRLSASILSATPDDSEGDAVVLRAAGAYFQQAADLVAAGDPIGWQRKIGAHLTAAASVYTWLLLNRFRPTDRRDHIQETHHFRDIIGLSGLTPESIRHAKWKAGNAEISVSAIKLAEECGNLLDSVLNHGSRKPDRKPFRSPPRHRPSRGNIVPFVPEKSTR